MVFSKCLDSRSQTAFSLCHWVGLVHFKLFFCAGFHPVYGGCWLALTRLIKGDQSLSSTFLWTKSSIEYIRESVHISKHTGWSRTSTPWSFYGALSFMLFNTYQQISIISNIKRWTYPVCLYKLYWLLDTLSSMQVKNIIADIVRGRGEFIVLDKFSSSSTGANQ